MTQFICVLGAPQTQKTTIAAEIFWNLKKICSPTWLIQEPVSPYNGFDFNGIDSSWMLDQFWDVNGNFDYCVCDFHPIQTLLYSCCPSAEMNVGYILKKFDILSVESKMTEWSPLYLKEIHQSLLDKAKKMGVYVAPLEPTLNLVRKGQLI